MPPKALIYGICVLLCSVALALAAGARQFEELWRRGEFDRLAELLASYDAAAAQSVDELEAAARAAFEIRNYDRGAELYGALADESEHSIERYIEARSMQLRCRWEQSDHDLGADWLRSARDEIENVLGAEGSSGKARRIALELDYFIGELTGRPSKHEKQLFREFPAADSSLRDAKAAIDDISIEADDQKRRALVERFLETYPETAWRHTAYRYLLHTEYRLADHDALAGAARQYLAEYPDNPESLGAVSRYYFEADFSLDVGLEYAQRSLELYETVLGLDGSQASLERLNRETAELERQPDYYPPGDRAQFLNYLGSRYNLARYHLLNEYAEAALALVRPVIELDPYTTNEQESLGPFYLLAGQAAEMLGEPEEAYRYLTGALVEGDTRHRYGWLAAQARSGLELPVSEAEAESARLAYLPSWLDQSDLPVFADVTERAGLAKLAHRRVAWGDVQNDGYPDLLLDGGALLINNRQGQFVDLTAESGLPGRGNGGLFADIDNDGDLDIYSFGGAGESDRLWRNEDGKFTDIAAIAGNPSDEYATEAASWIDADQDGWIDLYAANYELPASAAGGELGVGTPDYLYMNNGTGVLRRSSEAASGMVPPFGLQYAGRGAAAADFNNNGRQDLFVGNYRLQENFLWVSAGAGEFDNGGRWFNVAGRSIDQWWGHTIGSAWGDIDNDGDLDLFSANLAHPRFEYFSDKSQLLINSGPAGDFSFVDERSRRGIKFEETHADPAFFDANNDGALDLYVTSTYPNRRSFLYLNDGTGNFSDVTYLAGARVFDGWGCAWADYDLDGDLDLAVGSPNGVRLLRNAGGTGNWLQVACRGAAGTPPERVTTEGPLFSQTFTNTAAIGARVTLSAGELTQVREIQSGKGTGSGNELLAHFGLGDYRGECTIEVRFTSGIVIEVQVDSVNQRLVINEIDALAEVEPAGDTEETEDTGGDSPFSRDSLSR